MSVYGKKIGDESIQVEACRCYARGIESQLVESRANQQKLTTGIHAEDIYDEEAVCVPLMFCFFESMMCTSFAAWAQHSNAAGQMLEMLGPQKCRDGVLHHLFCSVRVATVFFDNKNRHLSLTVCRSITESHGRRPPLWRQMSCVPSLSSRGRKLPWIE